jgi:phosphatidate cytidylyltransferase
MRSIADLSGKFADLRLRLISAIAVGAVALLCVWLGGIWIAVLAAFAALAMILEWRSITAHAGRPAGMDAVPYAVAAVAGVLAVYAGVAWAGALLLIGLTLAGYAWDARRGRERAGRWAVAGAIYVGGAAMAFVALRGVETYGFLSIIWAASVVIAADVGGYFAGRTIGGPKLWPAVSPNKTWAGLVGGLALAAIVGSIFSGATTGTYFYQVCTVSAIAALLAQAGDLAESALKRHFGVKDAGTLVPGHGGLLDRLDGHMAAILVAALVTFTRDQAVFVW